MKYIHFLDSDDMLSLDCIERCVSEIGENEIIWHDVEHIYENSIQVQSHPTLLESLKLSEKEAQEKHFNALQLWQNLESFSWVHQGLFSFTLAQNLRFSTPLANEDALFGMILFAQAKTIKIAPFKGLLYRYHINSVSSHGESQSLYRKQYPYFMNEITTAFQDGYTIKHYYFAYSCTFVCLGLLSYIQTLKDSELKNKLIEFLQVRAIYAFGSMHFKYDPKHIRELLKPLEPYMQKVSLNTKIAYFTPKIFKILRWSKKALKKYSRFISEKVINAQKSRI